ncbi:hypothetical protein EVAR_42875_1 [Eumeta japonica]|uniref:Uncharacterized protein n=1 Tax=Eumeta variegata TaxID=151549 RepID=A0A4C1YDW7_EUMVA|nr:hypothetical protein EVAR_42875_1 [Eumeta japonica]
MLSEIKVLQAGPTYYAGFVGVLPKVVEYAWAWHRYHGEQKLDLSVSRGTSAIRPERSSLSVTRRHRLSNAHLQIDAMTTLTDLGDSCHSALRYTHVSV